MKYKSQDFQKIREERCLFQRFVTSIVVLFPEVGWGGGGGLGILLKIMLFYQSASLTKTTFCFSVLVMAFTLERRDLIFSMLEHFLPDALQAC